MWRILAAALLAIGACQGCQYFNPIGPAIQLGIYWVEGEAHKYYNTDQQSMVLAVRASLKELEIPITDEEVRDNVIVIHAGGKTFASNDQKNRRLGFKEEKAKLSGDDRFKIRITMVKPNTTKISIRANVFGDKPYCEMIYRHIDAQPKIKQFVTMDELNSAR